MNGGCWWVLGAVFAFLGCGSAVVQPESQAPHPRSAPSGGHTVGFRDAQLHAFFTLRLPSAFQAARRVDMPAEIASIEPEAKAKLKVSVYVPKTVRAAQPKKLLPIGQYLSGTWSASQNGSAKTVAFDAFVLGRNWLLKLELSSDTLSQEQLKKTLTNIIESFDMSRRLSGTL